MWLLSTDRAELQLFRSVEAARRAGYAILSHVWDDTEQTFQETEALRTAGIAEEGYNPRDHSSAKVRESCLLAERHGYKWIWNDACCIDKTSSSELSEAINSMFSYYACADVCYAYLGDVSPGRAMAPTTSGRLPVRFARSRWFGRGWTLQELLAPAQVIFLSSDWGFICTKGDEAETLASFTRIPVAILTLEEEIWDMSVAERMSWAGKRATTRLEDEAYCLMGIFDIHMPTIYGEGRKAFRRLQEEIMRKSIDTSLFAWGVVCNSLPDPGDVRPLRFEGHDRDQMYLLATSPSDFGDCAGFVFGSKRATTDKVNILPGAAAWSSPPLTLAIPTFEITPYGVRAMMPVIQMQGFSIAVLCTSDRDANPLGLLLGGICETSADPTRPLYYTGITTVHREPGVIRLMNIRRILHHWPQFLTQFENPPLVQLYLADTRQKSLELTRNILNCGTTPFHAPDSFLTKLRDRATYFDVLPKDLQAPWFGDETVTLWLRYESEDRGVAGAATIQLGRCIRSPARRHWATAHHCNYYPPPTAAPWVPLHDCAKDHVEDWFSLELTTKYYQDEIVVSFAPYPLNPTKTYVLTRVVWKLDGKTILNTDD